MCIQQWVSAKYSNERKQGKKRKEKKEKKNAHMRLLYQVSDEKKAQRKNKIKIKNKIGKQRTVLNSKLCPYKEIKKKRKVCVTLHYGAVPSVSSSH